MVDKYELLDEEKVNRSEVIYLKDNLPMFLLEVLTQKNIHLRDIYVIEKYPIIGSFQTKQKSKFQISCYKDSNKGREFLLKEVLSFLWIYPEFENIIKDVDLLLDWIHTQEKESNFKLDKFLEEEVYTFMLNENRIKESKKRVRKSKIKRKLKPFNLEGVYFF